MRFLFRKRAFSSTREEFAVVALKRSPHPKGQQMTPHLWILGTPKEKKQELIETAQLAPKNKHEDNYTKLSLVLSKSFARTRTDPWKQNGNPNAERLDQIGEKLHFLIHSARSWWYRY